MVNDINKIKQDNIERIIYMLKNDTIISDTVREDLAFNLGLKRSQVDDFIDESIISLEQKMELLNWLNKNITELKDLEEKLKDVNENYYINSKLRRIILEVLDFVRKIYSKIVVIFKELI